MALQPCRPPLPEGEKKPFFRILSGSQVAEEAKMFPNDSVQSIISPSLWWEETETKTLERDCLVYAFIPHVDQVPYTIRPVGRLQPEQHGSAKLDIAPLRMKNSRKKEDLPVAAMAIHDSELWVAYRAKKDRVLCWGIMSHL